MNAVLLGLTASEIRRRIPEMEEFAELGDFFDRPVRTYSSGMALRLAFAVATHADADVLIVDEALAVGDGYFQKKSIDRITDFQKRGGTLLFCSHALYYVALLCDHAIWLKQEEVASSGAALPVVRAYEAFLQPKERDRAKAAGTFISRSRTTTTRLPRLMRRPLCRPDAIARSGTTTIITPGTCCSPVRPTVTIRITLARRKR